ncbi:MAG: hypothetical protein K2N23_03660 [Clostridia bacterium]|nr:hypothetical protein [Clostridia bacterium]
MKNAKKTASIVASAFISLCFVAGCGSVTFDPGNTISKDELIRDIDVAPVQHAKYEEYSKQVLKDYEKVAKDHLKDDEIDIEDKDVIAAASTAAAKLFAYACYNERHLDRYVYFSNQEGDTNLSTGSGTAVRQEYFLRVNETENTCGYKYHYTIKKVMESSGAMSMFKDQFESAKLRIVVDTDVLYRLKGSKLEVGEHNDVLDLDLLTCEWRTDSDWGIPDKTRLVKGDFIAPDKIAKDIVDNADKEDFTIHGNINILAENIVSHAVITRDESENGEEGYVVFMSIDTKVANEDKASLKMLRNANSSGNCQWVSEDGASGLTIVFRLWENGLFRMYSVSEKWKGSIAGFSGMADSSTTYYYSYSDRDCDMTKYLEMLEEAKANKGE